MRLTAKLGVAVATVAAVCLLGPPASLGKGQSSIVGATVSGGGLGDPRHVAIALPEGLDDMFEAPAQSSSALRYDVVLHYDFEDEGGRHDWLGKWDGSDLLYFPERMVVVNGVWAAGWYRAAPELASALWSASWHLRPGDRPSRHPQPAKGSVPNSHSVLIAVNMVLGVLLIGAGVATRRPGCAV
jgi:hypothetical protein